MRSWAARHASVCSVVLVSLVLASSCSMEEESSSAIVITSPKNSAGGSGGVSGKGGGGGSDGQGGSQPGSGGSAGSAGGSAGSTGTTAGQGGSSGGMSNQGGGGEGGFAGSAQGGASGGVGAPEASIVFLSPQEGQIFQQVGFPAEALIPFEVQVSQGITRVQYRIENGELMADKTNAPSFAHTHPFKIAGQRWVEAQGFDGAGTLLATAKVNFTVQAPILNGCLDELKAMGVPFVTTQAKGVVDAVKLQGPLNGVFYTSGLKETPTNDPIACEFVKTLWAFADVVKAQGYVRVGTLGSYCYRCCCAWSQTNYCRGPDDPEPDCGSKGYSNHSWGRAVDVRYLIKADGTIHDINNPTHFVTYGGTDTCGAGIAQQSGISLALYKIVCDAHKQKLFNTILTPNYNAAHRNHLHMDTGKSGVATGAVAKIAPDFSWQVDTGDHEDHCGP
ncbi:MAG: extensin family protein [Myxococcales bacterium]|nr:extensin family protein [Polyangiaceae bacterium]MDW8248588.1 extensin family protein [Myxococcales bacterium]